MFSKESKHIIQHGRGPSCLPSCFRASPVSDSDEVESLAVRVPSGRRKVSCLSWPRPGKKEMKTVPVESSSELTSSLNATISTASVAEASARKSFSGRLQKPRSETSRRNPQEQFHDQGATVIRSEEHHEPRVPQLARKYSARLHSVQPTRNTQPHSPKSNLKIMRTSEEPERKLGPEAGFAILVATFGVMVVWGRACAIVCLCVFLYFVPLLNTAAEDATKKKASTASNNVDMDSAEYKKRVVLEGLLERTRRRASAGFVPPGAI